MKEANFDDEYLFESRRDYQNQYSTFIEQLQQSTQKLMNEVFNAQYVPKIDEHQININANHQQTNNKDTYFQSAANSRKKKFTPADFNNSKRTMATKAGSQRELSQSFVNFLTRNEKWKQRKMHRAKNQHNKKQEDELKGLTFIPSILSSSRQKQTEPIYKRCLQLQQQKQKKLTLKRMQKDRWENQQLGQYTYQPQILTKTKNRTLEEYLKDKDDWNNRKINYLQNQKILRDAKKYEQCIFQPILVAKYHNGKQNLRSQKTKNITGERVEDRLLRSLQKSIQKREKISSINESARNKK